MGFSKSRLKAATPSNTGAKRKSARKVPIHMVRAGNPGVPPIAGQTAAAPLSSMQCAQSATNAPLNSAACSSVPLHRRVTRRSLLRETAAFLHCVPIPSACITVQQPASLPHYDTRNLYCYSQPHCYMCSYTVNIYRYYSESFSVHASLYLYSFSSHIF